MPRQIYTGYKLFPYEWNATDSRIVIPPGCDESQSGYPSSIRNAIQNRGDTGCGGEIRNTGYRGCRRGGGSRYKGRVLGTFGHYGVYGLTEIK